MNRCPECKNPLPAGADGPLCARCAKRPEVEPPPQKRHNLFVDPELALEHRVARLEELELLRLALHQAHEEHGRCVESKLPAEAEHWAEQMQEAQKKIAAIIQAINKTVRARLDERDRRRDNAS